LPGSNGKSAGVAVKSLLFIDGALLALLVFVLARIALYQLEIWALDWLGHWLDRNR
jgi:hypothetical protein